MCPGGCLAGLSTAAWSNLIRLSQASIRDDHGNRGSEKHFRVSLVQVHFGDLAPAGPRFSTSRGTIIRVHIRVPGY